MKKSTIDYGSEPWIIGGGCTTMAIPNGVNQISPQLKISFFKRGSMLTHLDIVQYNEKCYSLQQNG